MSSNRKRVNDSEFDVDRKYRLTTVMKKEIGPKLYAQGSKTSELLGANDMEQMLNVYLDDYGMWNLNINSSFYVMDIPEEALSTYFVPATMKWTTVSYNVYGTTRLAWLLMKINGVLGASIFESIPAGSSVKYLEKGKYVTPILAAIRDNAEGING